MTPTLAAAHQPSHHAAALLASSPGRAAAPLTPSPGCAALLPPSLSHSAAPSLSPQRHDATRLHLPPSAPATPTPPSSPRTGGTVPSLLPVRQRAWSLPGAAVFSFTPQPRSRSAMMKEGPQIYLGLPVLGRQPTVHEAMWTPQEPAMLAGNVVARAEIGHADQITEGAGARRLGAFNKRKKRE